MAKSQPIFVSKLDLAGSAISHAFAIFLEWKFRLPIHCRPCEGRGPEGVMSEVKKPTLAELFIAAERESHASVVLRLVAAIDYNLERCLRTAMIAVAFPPPRLHCLVSRPFQANSQCPWVNQEHVWCTLVSGHHYRNEQIGKD